LAVETRAPKSLDVFDELVEAFAPDHIKRCARPALVENPARVIAMRWDTAGRISFECLAMVAAAISRSRTRVHNLEPRLVALGLNLLEGRTIVDRRASIFLYVRKNLRHNPTL
jgi:hypothetical protein